MKQAKKMIKFRNFVAKNIKTCGAGAHKAKTGTKSSRARQKQNLIRSQINIEE
jgi:hypothetical protein